MKAPDSGREWCSGYRYTDYVAVTQKGYRIYESRAVNDNWQRTKQCFKYVANRVGRGKLPSIEPSCIIPVL